MYNTRVLQKWIYLCVIWAVVVLIVAITVSTIISGRKYKWRSARENIVIKSHTYNMHLDSITCGVYVLCTCITYIRFTNFDLSNHMNITFKQQNFSIIFFLFAPITYTQIYRVWRNTSMSLSLKGTNMKYVSVREKNV